MAGEARLPRRHARKVGECLTPAWGLEPRLGAVDGFAPQGAREVDKLAARRVEDGRAGIVGIAVDRVGIVEARVGDIQGLAADGTTALLLGQQLLAQLEVGRGRLTLGEPPVGLVEGHPLPVLLGLALAGWKRRQALVVEANTVPLAVGGNPGLELFAGEPWSAAARAVEARACGAVVSSAWLGVGGAWALAISARFDSHMSGEVIRGAEYCQVKIELK